MAQHGTAWHSMAQHGTAWHSMAQHGTAWHSLSGGSKTGTIGVQMFSEVFMHQSGRRPP